MTKQLSNADLTDSQRKRRDRMAGCIADAAARGGVTESQLRQQGFTQAEVDQLGPLARQKAVADNPGLTEQAACA